MTTLKRATALFRSVLPGVVEVTFSASTFSVMGTASMAEAARASLPACELVDWSDDADFVACGTPFELYVSVADLEALLLAASEA